MRLKWTVVHLTGVKVELFEAVLADAGIQVVLTGVRIPQMNAIMERWIKSCHCELLACALIWNH